MIYIFKLGRIFLVSVMYTHHWHLLFIHAISGCDTTSRPYGIGKTSAKDKAANLHEHA